MCNCFCDSNLFDQGRIKNVWGPGWNKVRALKLKKIVPMYVFIVTPDRRESLWGEDAAQAARRD